MWFFSVALRAIGPSEDMVEAPGADFCLCLSA
jgi:hypothetical protein